MRPPTGAWSTHWKLYPWRELTLQPPGALNYPKLLCWGPELVICSQLHVVIMVIIIVCRIFVGSRICCGIMSVAFCHVQKILLTLFLHDLWLLQHFCSLFYDSHWVLGSGKCDLVWFGPENSRHVFPPLWVQSFLLNTVCYTKKLLWWGLGTALVYGYRDTNLEGNCYYSHLAR